HHPGDDGDHSSRLERSERFAPDDGINNRHGDRAGRDWRYQRDRAERHGAIKERDADPGGNSGGKSPEDLLGDEGRPKDREEERGQDERGSLCPEADDIRRETARGNAGEVIADADARRRAQSEGQRQHLAAPSWSPPTQADDRTAAAVRAQDSTPTAIDDSA